jgi:hypothetical protein
MPTPIESLLPRTSTRAVPLPKGDQVFAALDLRGSAPKVLMLMAARTRREAIEVFLAAGPVKHLAAELSENPKALKAEMIAMIESGAQFAVVKIGRQYVRADR